MRSAGILLIVAGAFVVYAVVHGHLAQPQSSGSGSSGGGGGGGGASSSAQTAAQTDSGSHSAIDLTGLVTGNPGNVYTYSGSYGDASSQAQDDMNAFAHQIGNILG